MRSSTHLGLRPALITQQSYIGEEDRDLQSWRQIPPEVPDAEIVERIKGVVAQDCILHSIYWREGDDFMADCRPAPPLIYNGADGNAPQAWEKQQAPIKFSFHRGSADTRWLSVASHHVLVDDFGLNLVLDEIMGTRPERLSCMSHDQYWDLLRYQRESSQRNLSNMLLERFQPIAETQSLYTSQEESRACAPQLCTTPRWTVSWSRSVHPYGGSSVTLRSIPRSIVHLGSFVCHLSDYFEISAPSPVMVFLGRDKYTMRVSAPLIYFRPIVTPDRVGKTMKEWMHELHASVARVAVAGPVEGGVSEQLLHEHHYHAAFPSFNYVTQNASSRKMQRPLRAKLGPSRHGGHDNIELRVQAGNRFESCELSIASCYADRATCLNLAVSIQNSTDNDR